MLYLLLLLALMAGLAKCWSISQRPTTNRKCVGSLMVLLVAPMTFIAAVWSFVSFPALESLNIILGLLPSAIAVCAALLAIAGLKDYSRARGYYTQGQVQAFATLVVSGLLVALMVVAQFGGMLSGFLGRERAVGGRPLVLEELNFKFLAPSGPWSQVDTNPIGLKATLSFRRTKPELYFLIVAQKTPSEPYSLDELCDLAIRNLSNAVDTLRVTYRSTTSIAGKEGMRLHMEAAKSGQKSHHQYRLLISGDCIYQLAAWGADRQRIAVAEEAEDLITRFALLDASGGLRKNWESWCIASAARPQSNDLECGGKRSAAPLGSGPRFGPRTKAVSSLRSATALQNRRAERRIPAILTEIDQAYEQPNRDRLRNAQAGDSP